MQKNIIKSDKCYSSKEYIGMITGSEPKRNPTLSQIENLQLNYWNYPINEIEHIIDNNLSVVLVKFPGNIYRFCEI